MSASDDFDGAADLTEHFRRRLASDQQTLATSWKANQPLLDQLKILNNLSSKNLLRTSGFEILVTQVQSGGVVGGKTPTYQSPVVGVNINFNALKKGKSSLEISLGVDGQYTLTYGGMLGGKVVETTSRNKVNNALNTWLADLGQSNGLNVIDAMLKRQRDVAERQVAASQKTERAPK